MKSAIYARQSKDRKDSVSIDAQIEKCIALCHFKGKDYKVYKDKGYSGKNTNRPDYSEIIMDINAGLIDEVVVYRVDRISRNLNDFTGMVAEFDKYNVSFASATESFDTSSPMGRAMMYLLMVFAQLERETIAERIKDNAMYRAQLGRWTSGSPPIGYIKKKEDGKAKIYPDTSTDIISNIYDWYLEPNGTVRSVTGKLNILGIKTANGNTWTHRTLSRLIQNVVYATNTMEVYEYFKNVQTDFIIQNESEEYDGTHGMIYYRENDNKRRKEQNLKLQDKYVIIGEHQGVIPGDMWVKAQEKLDNNRRKAPREAISQNTFLNGIVSCGMCGGYMGVKWIRSGSNKRFYFDCNSNSVTGTSRCKNKTIRVDKLEEEITKRILNRCKNKRYLDYYVAKAKKIETESIAPLHTEKNLLTAQIKVKENEIDNLLSNLKSVKLPIVVKEIEKGIEKVSNEIESINSRIQEVEYKISNYKNQIVNNQLMVEAMDILPKVFESADISQKRVMIRGIINRINVNNGDITVDYFK